MFGRSAGRAMLHALSEVSIRESSLVRKETRSFLRCLNKTFIGKGVLHCPTKFVHTFCTSSFKADAKWGSYRVVDATLFGETADGDCTCRVTDWSKLQD